jgi:rhomboid protease GluP
MLQGYKKFFANKSDEYIQRVLDEPEKHQENKILEAKNELFLRKNDYKNSALYLNERLNYFESCINEVHGIPLKAVAYLQISGNLKHFLVHCYLLAKQRESRFIYLGNKGFLVAIYDNGKPTSDELWIKIEGNQIYLEISRNGAKLVDFEYHKNQLIDFLISVEIQLNNLSETEFQEGEKAFSEASGEYAEEDFNRPPPSASDQLSMALSIFKPSQKFIVTPTITFLLILYYLFLVFNGVDWFAPNMQSLYDFGANIKVETLGGDYWRLLVGSFMPSGILHLFFCVYALYFAGAYLEPVLGTFRFILLILVAAIGGSVSSIYFTAWGISLGGSPMILGLFTAFFILLKAKIIDKSNKQGFIQSTVVFACYIGGLIVKGNADFYAYLGGIFFAGLTTLIFIPGLKNEQSEAFNLAGVTISPILLVIFTVFTITTSFKHYDRVFLIYDKINSNESMATEIWNYDFEKTSQFTLLYNLNQRGIYYWEENLKLIDKFNVFSDLPKDLQKHNELLTKYYELRIEQYKKLTLKIKEGTTKYDLYLQKLDYDIQNLLNEMN